MIRAAVVFLTVSTSAFAVVLPDKTFFSGNDVYQWCQRDKAMAQSYVAGLPLLPKKLGMQSTAAGHAVQIEPGLRS
jgi:hypothetical protein